MRILIEEHEYAANLVKDILPGEQFRNVDDFVSVKYVGYFYNPTIKDTVFVLPKVLMTGDESDTRTELLFGKYNPEDVIDVDQAEIDATYRKFLYKFSVWIYRAIKVYLARVKNDPVKRNLILHRYVPVMGRGRVKRQSHTMLDVIVALLEFNRDNRDFFIFTAKNLHSGMNKINWTRTINHSQCYFDSTGGSPIYLSPVNKKKVVNFDEELFVIYYSILNYIGEDFGFKTEVPLGYEPIRGNAFVRYLNGYGKRRLQEIKYKYFSDRALRLWELCYAFFESAYVISLSTDKMEYLLAKNFYVVFEAMIDELVGDSRDKLPDGLKDQADGKRVDHLYSDRALTNNDQKEREVYYIGDSKYYKLKNELGAEAVYKQFTYARNVIQWNLDLFLDGENKPLDRPYRDDMTEGYDIIPNFFISGTVDEALSYADNVSETSKPLKTHISRQFENRLFDRDTLLIAHYDVNFLYILSLYARDKANEKAAWKSKVRKLFREQMQGMLTKHFDFYALTPRGGVATEGFLREHFQELLGKVYTPYDEVGKTSLWEHLYYSLALERPLTTEEIATLPIRDRARALDRKQRLEEENENTLLLVGQGFKYVPCKIGDDPSKLLTPEPPIIVSPSAIPANLPKYPLQSISDKWVLVGCIKNQAHKDWIFKTIPKFKRDAIYNVRLDKSRDGAMNKSELTQKHVRFVVMYELADPAKYMVYRVRNNAFIKQERMRLSEYPNPQGNYFCFILDEQVSFGAVNIPALLNSHQRKLGPKFVEGAPFCVKGAELIGRSDV